MNTNSTVCAQRILIAAMAASSLALPLAAHAGDIYVNAGLPGVMLGYAQPVSESITLRVDAATLTTHVDGHRDGMDYRGRAQLDRVGLFGDWFAFTPGGFRLTGGITVNDMRGNWTGRGNGELVTVGDVPYLLTAKDRIDVQVKFPRTTPYLGIGWGRQAVGDAGWGFSFDLGASLGRFTVTGQAQGPVLSSPMAQEDFQRELADLRDKADRYRFVPQLTIGVGYRF